MRGLLTRRRQPEGPPPPPPRFPRMFHVEHHWLTVTVLRNEERAPGARLVLRRYLPDGSLGEVAARATTDAEGETRLLLHDGRYAVSAWHGGDSRCVSVTVEREGRAVLRLLPTGPRVIVTVDVVRSDGRAAVEAYVEARGPEGHLAARGWTDDRGAAALLVPPGPVEVRVGEKRVRLEAAADAHVRVQLPAFEVKPAPKPFPADPSLPTR